MSTRERLIDATARIIRDRGIKAVTTKDVALEAGFAEATIYRHFQDKEDLLLHALSERVPGHFLAVLRELPQRAGTGEVAAHLLELARASVAFFAQNAPFTAALGADPALAASHFARLRQRGTGPVAVQRVLETYLREEQRLGRVNADVNPIAAAYLLLGICFNYARSRYIGSDPTGFSEEEFVTEIVRTLMTGLAPAPVAETTDPDR
jgi:AcrR family transcriptional regulator